MELQNYIDGAEEIEFFKRLNETRTEYPRDAAIHAVFEAQAARTPEKLALKYDGDELSYAELNAKSNRLARFLRQSGIRNGTFVGLFLPRSINLIVAILGILKAGGCYVPFDVDYPLERLNSMLEETQPPTLLTEDNLLDELPTFWGQTVCLDADWETIESESAENLNISVSADDAAYIIYTSGSTGQPKGVVVPHRGVVRLVKKTNYTEISEEDIFLQMSPVTFDASMFEIWGALLNGATLCPLEKQKPTLAEIGCAVRENQVTILWLTSGLFNVMIEEQSADLSSVRQLLAGGDVLSPTHVRQAQSDLPNCRIINGYGPTESTTFACCHRTGTQDESKPIPIGKPVSNTFVYVLDEKMRLVSKGDAGELFIGGDGLAHGYLNNCSLTAAKFVPHPFSEIGERLYRTGDIVKISESENLEFVGRRDRQIKVRGFRIEPSEIEAVLNSHSVIKESVVSAVANDEQNAARVDKKILVGYIVCRDAGNQPMTDNLRRFLSEKLPEYMIPATFVFLDQIPLTANGKINREALPLPKSENADENHYTAPRNNTEKTLAEIWMEILDIERVGIHDGFFDLGGDSIRSLQVLSKAQEAGGNLKLEQIFEYQTIAELAEVLDANQSLTETPKREKVSAFVMISAEDREKLPSDTADAYPLTALQTGMLFHSEFEPQEGLYHDVFSYRVKAKFDRKTVRETLRKTTAQHEILRTSFDLVNYNEPLQIVHSETEIPLEIIDLQNLSVEAQNRRIDDWITAERSLPFDWDKAPLLRVAVHRRGETEFDFGLSFHHAILDGWSLALLLEEIFSEYVSILKNSPTAAEQLKSRYADFVAGELEIVSSDEAKKFWADKLADAPSTEIFHRAAKAQNVKILQKQIFIADEISDGIKDLASAWQIPLKSVLFAAHLKVLSVLSGKSEIVSGLVTNGRTETADGDKVLGLFLNTLPFWFNLKAGSWQEMAKRVFASETEISAFRRFPLAKIQAASGNANLFDTAFNFTHFHAYKNAQTIEDFEVLEARAFTATNFPFFTDFSLDVRTEKIQLRFNYDANLLNENFADRIAGYFTTVLNELVNEPEKNHAEFSPLNDDEKHQLLIECSGKKADYSIDFRVHELFERQVENTSNAVAVKTENEAITYGELNERANRLANYLLSVLPKENEQKPPVAFCVNRSVDSIITLLAILKTGSPYLPLDAEYPPERLRFMLEDAQAKFLILTEETKNAVGETSCKIVNLQTEAAKIESHSAENPRRLIFPDETAYVLYTSGSTGEPKGVMISHLSVVNHLLWRQKTYPLTVSDKFLHKASYGFDISVWEVFGTLASGATLVSAVNGGQRDAAYLADLIAREQMTVIHFSPAMWERILDEPRLQDANSVRRVLCGGELLTGELQVKIIGRFPEAQLIHQYGPTETAIVVTAFECERQGQNTGAVPIGKAIDNTQVYILDELMNLLPFGATGELFIGGIALAHGYHGKADLTAEKFVPHPFSENGERLYRTGDLARFSADGNLEFLGRADYQIKIRGYRVELGEIEIAAARHPQIKRCVAQIRKNSANETELVGYLETGKNAVPFINDLREFLANRLPEYMIPQAFYIIEKMPLTPNGKINRRELEKIGSEMLKPQAEFIAPQTETEKILAEIWREVLGLSKISVNADFFELGGHSLKAIQIIARVRDRFRLDVPLRELFAQKTVSEMASLIENLQLEQTDEAQLAEFLADMENLSNENAASLVQTGNFQAKGN